MQYLTQIAVVTLLSAVSVGCTASREPRASVTPTYSYLQHSSEMAGAAWPVPSRLGAQHIAKLPPLPAAPGFGYSDADAAMMTE